MNIQVLCHLFCSLHNCLCRKTHLLGLVGPTGGSLGVLVALSAPSTRSCAEAMTSVSSAGLPEVSLVTLQITTQMLDNILQVHKVMKI